MLHIFIEDGKKNWNGLNTIPYDNVRREKKKPNIKKKQMKRRTKKTTIGAGGVRRKVVNVNACVAKEITQSQNDPCKGRVVRPDTL